MEKTTFEISKMDCPSEENLIRMKLDGISSIKNLNFDIPNRKLFVFHVGEIDQIEKSINELKLGGRKIVTVETNQTHFEIRSQSYGTKNSCSSVITMCFVQICMSTLNKFY